MIYISKISPDKIMAIKNLSTQGICRVMNVLHACNEQQNHEQNDDSPSSSLTLNIAVLILLIFHSIYGRWMRLANTSSARQQKTFDTTFYMFVVFVE